MKPNKFFYTIGEVAELIGVEPHVLRYWEKEFKFSTIKRNNRRRYTLKNIEYIKKIHHLLYEKGYTIAGAKKALKNSKKIKNEKKVLSNKAKKIIEDIKKDLDNLRKIFDDCI